MKQALRAVLLFLLLGVCSGAACERRGGAPPHRPPSSKVEAFKQDQAATMTPHGRILLASVQETPDGVEYRTEDGSTWRVAMEHTADGWRVHGPPEAVK